MNSPQKYNTALNEPEFTGISNSDTLRTGFSSNPKNERRRIDALRCSKHG
jgi:hypothetical protein